jgi:hypothetical protein
VAKPEATDRDIFVSAQRTGLFRVDRDTGRSTWLNKQADSFLSTNQRFVYARDRSGLLLVLDYARGSTLAQFDMRDWLLSVPNDLTDRIYLANTDGQIICLRNRSEKMPLRNKTFDWMLPKKLDKKDEGLKKDEPKEKAAEPKDKDEAKDKNDEPKDKQVDPKEMKKEGDKDKDDVKDKGKDKAKDKDKDMGLAPARIIENYAGTYLSGRTIYSPLPPVLRGERARVRGDSIPCGIVEFSSHRAFHALTPDPSPGVPGEGSKRCSPLGMADDRLAEIHPALI